MFKINNVLSRLIFYIVCLLIPLPQSSYAQEASMTPTVILSGIVLQPDSCKTIFFRFYKDFLSFEELNYPAELKKDSFFIKIPLAENMPGFISYGEENIPIYLETGDSLFIKMNGSDFANSLSYSGKGELANNYLKAAFLQFDDIERIEASIAQNTAQGFSELMQQFKEEKINFLDSFLIKRDTQFTQAFKTYAQADIDYWWGYNLMRYKNEHPASHIFPVTLTLPDEYFRFTDALELNNEKALNNLNYLYYLDHYAKWRQERLEKGLLKIEKAQKTTEKLLEIKVVETLDK